jgi:hypothetical protein
MSAEVACNQSTLSWKLHVLTLNGRENMAHGAGMWGLFTSVSLVEPLIIKDKHAVVRILAEMNYPQYVHGVVDFNFHSILGCPGIYCLSMAYPC